MEQKTQQKDKNLENCTILSSKIPQDKIYAMNFGLSGQLQHSEHSKDL